MKRQIVNIFTFLLLSGLAWGQFTQVTGTVIDPNGIPYANGTVTAKLNSSTTPTLNGFPYTPPTQPAGLNLSGSFVMNLAANTPNPPFLPSGTTWTFTVNCGTGCVLPSSGVGPVQFSTAPITISGTSQDITTQLHAVALALSTPTGTIHFPGAPPGGGGQCSAQQTAVNDSTQQFFICAAGGVWTPISAAAGATAFGSVTPGTNGGALVIGTTGALTRLGNGVIDANQLNSTSLAALITGVLCNTTATGVPFICGVGNFPTFNQSTTGTSSGFTGVLAGDTSGTQGATTTTKINGQSLAALATGPLKNNTGTGVPTIYTVQGTDANLASSGTVSGTAAPLCTDAQGGLTTVGCPVGANSVTDMRSFPPTLFAGDTGLAIQAACATMPAAGGILDARGLTYPLYIKTQPFSGCNSAIQIEFNAGDVWVSNPIVIPNQRGGIYGVATGTGNGLTPGTVIHFCNTAGPNGCGPNPNAFPNVTPNFINVGGPYLVDAKSAAFTCAGTVPTANGPCNATPLIIIGGNAATAKAVCNVGSFGDTITQLGLDVNGVLNGIGVYSCSMQEDALIQQIQDTGFSLAGMMFDATNGSGTNPTHKSIFDIDIHTGGTSVTSANPVPIAGLSRTANVVTVTPTVAMALAPGAHQPVTIVAASDPTFAGIYVVCTPTDNAGCITPTTTSFTYFQAGQSNGNSTATSSANFRTDGLVEEMNTAQNATTMCCFATIVGDGVAEGNNNRLQNALWRSGGCCANYQNIHIENTSGDSVLVGANETTQGVLFTSIDFGGAIAAPAGVATIHFLANTIGSTAINTRMNTGARFVILDDNAGPGIVANTMPGNTVSFYPQGQYSGAACYKTGVSPFACGNTNGGIATIAVGQTSVTVNTGSVSALSIIQLTVNTSAACATATGAASCNPTTIQQPAVTAIVAGTSFTITVPVAVAGNPQGVNWTIRN